jgi:hypothetical protein
MANSNNGDRCAACHHMNYSKCTVMCDVILKKSFCTCAVRFVDNNSDKNTSWLPLQLCKPYLKQNKQEFNLELQ